MEVLSSDVTDHLILSQFILPYYDNSKFYRFVPHKVIRRPVSHIFHINLSETEYPR